VPGTLWRTRLIAEIAEKSYRMTSTKASEAEYITRILQSADRALAAVDEAYIIQERGHSQRPMPTFRPEEVTLGPRLGKGGFGIVNEIKSFCLDEELTSAKDMPAEASYVDNVADNPAAGTAETIPIPHCLRQDSFERHVHYDIQKAREFMRQKAQRNGTARYALKRLHDDLTELEKARGMIDLAIEAKYLSVVWHPNIGKISGRMAAIVQSRPRRMLSKILSNLDGCTIS
jgi:hypothetical protein